MYTSGVVALLLVACLLFILLLSEAPTTAAAETVKVITTPIFPQIPRVQTSKDFQVLVRVQAPPAAADHKGRVPIDLAVVLNVGASAGPERLASVKKAAKFIVRQLHDDDRLAIVGAPSSNRQQATVFLDIRDGRRNAEKLVDELEPRGARARYTSGTGLEEAVKMLEELPATSSTSSRASFVILVTDTAEDSIGFSNLLRRLRRNAAVHTLGLGASHDPRALLQIARESGGTYSFVDEQNVDSVSSAIAVCLSGLRSVVAAGARVRVEAAAASGVEITKIVSGGYERTIADDKTSGEVSVGFLYAGEVKSFIVHLNVPAVPSTTTSSTSLVDESRCDNQQLLTATFVDDDHRATSGDVMITQSILSVQRPPPETVAATAAQRVPFPAVVNHIVQFGVLETVDAFVQNEVLVLNSITAEVANSLAMELQGRWDLLVQGHQFWSGVDLGVLEIEIRNMVSSLLQAAGGGRASSSPVTAYMLSWLSSYQMQRPTAMGSANSIAAAFVTLDVQLMLQQVVTIPDGGCPACECVDGCVEPLPPPVFVPSGRDDGTFRVNGAYPAGAVVLAINQAMNQMYLAMVQASNLKRCDSSGVEALQAPAWAGS